MTTDTECPFLVTTDKRVDFKPIETILYTVPNSIVTISLIMQDDMNIIEKNTNNPYCISMNISLEVEKNRNTTNNTTQYLH
ncbi:MAG TPA: hypothetical protein DCF91_01890 [Porphyromonadaceae bacterium]|nr:hypothetical protein [Porphyromonadaceae bacterium]